MGFLNIITDVASLHGSVVPRLIFRFPERPYRGSQSWRSGIRALSLRHQYLLVSILLNLLLLVVCPDVGVTMHDGDIVGAITGEDIHVKLLTRSESSLKEFDDHIVEVQVPLLVGVELRDLRIPLELSLRQDSDDSVHDGVVVTWLRLWEWIEIVVLIKGPSLFFPISAMRYLIEPVLVLIRL